MGLGMCEAIVIPFLLFGVAPPILFWAPGGAELLILILFLFGFVAVIFAAIYYPLKYLNIIGGKICPNCGEKIIKVAKICRYCQRIVSGG